MWDALSRHKDRVAERRIEALFEADPERAERFSAVADRLLLDYSKTNIDDEIRAALIALCEGADLAGRRAAMFAGERINRTEDRAVLHTALRNLDGTRIEVNGQDVMPGIGDTLGRMRDFAHALRDGTIEAAGGRVTDVLNIGIGGSDLGPAMAVRALSPFQDGPQCHFVSNVDGAHIADTLARLDARRTLVIVASKTFTTVETMTNAETARRWMQERGGEVARQFVALSSAEDKAAAFGIPADHVFGFEDWVGGRYSVWGPIGLSLMLAIGPDRFDDFLRGGHAMDRHFRDADWSANLPVLLALVGIWHAQVCGHATRAVLPYEQRLELLPPYLQQLEMESNGKRVAMDGTSLDRPSGPVVWGAPGTNGQHAFFQLLHQGTAVVPCEFLVGARGHERNLRHHHDLLVANCLAQSQALMRGRTLEEARAQVARAGMSGPEADRQARHRVFPGNRPSLTLVYPQLDPFVLGQIVALYEHRVFVEGVILGINSFDQWGVELGKALATELQPVVEGTASAAAQDPSTAHLVQYLQLHGGSH